LSTFHGLEELPVGVACGLVTSGSGEGSIHYVEAMHKWTGVGLSVTGMVDDEMRDATLVAVTFANSLIAR
jgi:hypothetical protein